MADLATQIRDYIDTTSPPLEMDELALDFERFGAPLGRPNARRGLVAAFATAIAMVLIVGGVVAVLRSGDQDEPVVTEPPPTIPVTTAPVVVPVPETLPPPTTAVTTDVSDVETAIDYYAVATEIGVTDTPLGTVTWLESPRVPVAWFQEGYPPSGYTWPRNFASIYANAPCCIEIAKVGDEYLGFGVEEAIFESRDNRWVPQWNWPILPLSVWHSSDGETWDLMADDPFEPGTVVTHDPFVIGERNGRWILLGWAGWDGTVWNEWGDLDFDDAIPSAWFTDDLVTWTRIDFDFGKPGTLTELQSVVATEGGWAIFGVRRTPEKPAIGPRVAEWVGWASADGIEWEEIPIQDLLGPPDCAPVQRENCHRIKATATDDAIAIYAYKWDHPYFDIREIRFDILIGLLPE
jgi:hypothetical protein